MSAGVSGISDRTVSRAASRRRVSASAFGLDFVLETEGVTREELV